VSALDDLLEKEEPPLEVLTDEECWDDELKALVAVVETFSKLDEEAILRVMLYARSRYLPKKRLVDW
jgi:hypothetical protein